RRARLLDGHPRLADRALPREPDLRAVSGRAAVGAAGSGTRHLFPVERHVRGAVTARSAGARSLRRRPARVPRPGEQLVASPHRGLLSPDASPGRADAGASRDELRGLPRGAGPGRHDRGRPDVRVGAGRLLRDPAARAPRARECRQRARGALHRAGRAAAQAAPALSHGRGLAQPVLGARDPARLRERARRVLARGRSEPLILARVGEPRTRPTHWPAHAKFSPDRVNGRSVGVLPDTQGGPLMARAGYRIFDADTHIIEAAEPIEAYLSTGEKAKLASLGSLIGRAPGKAGVSRYRVGKRPELNRLLGSRDPVPPADAITR